MNYKEKTYYKNYLLWHEYRKHKYYAIKTKIFLLIEKQLK